MSMITNPVMLDSTGRKIAEALQSLVAIQAGEATTMDSWEKFQAMVRGGVAESVYPVGTKLTVVHATYGIVTFIIVGYNHNPDPTGRVEHTVTLLADGCPVSALQYDGSEALYYAETGLVAGTYNFTLPADYDTAYGGGKTLQFTLTQAVPIGGQVLFGWSYNTQSTDCKVSTYASNTSTEAIESGIAVTEGSDGVALGTADGKTANMNHIHRVRYGSNNWRESAMRQFLNSDAAAGNVWKPQTKFDRPPSWASTTDGWMKGLPAEFIKVVGAVDISTKTNTVFEVDGATSSSYITRDKFWLPSINEVGLGTENGIADGSVFELYSGATNADRIKYNSSGVARTWWLRSPYPWSACTVRLVGAAGALDGSGASSSGAVVPACVIY